MPGRKQWGGVARRGAGQVSPEQRQEGPRQRGRGRGRQEPPPKERREPKEPGPPPAWEPEQWIEEPDEPVRAAAGKAVSRGAKGAKKPGATQRPRRKAPDHVSKEIGAAVGKGLSANVEQ